MVRHPQCRRSPQCMSHQQSLPLIRPLLPKESFTQNIYVFIREKPRMHQESAVRLRNSRVTFWRTEGGLFICFSPSGDKQCSELSSPISGCSQELHTHSQSHLQSIQHAPSRLRSGCGSGCRRPCAGDHCDLREKSHWSNS